MFTLGESTLSQFLHAHAVKKCLFTQNLHGLEQFYKSMLTFYEGRFLNIDDHEKYFLSTQY